MFSVHLPGQHYRWCDSDVYTRNMASYTVTGRHGGWQALTKVPKVTVFFWIIKILTTAMGESTSDYLVQRFNPYLAVAFGLCCFVVAMVLQLSASRYVPWRYWIAVAMVAVFGTMSADVTHVALGVPYVISVTGFLIAMAVIFTSWYRVEGTLSIHSIYTRRRELFYWAAVLATFAFGTALGDFTAYTLHLGYFASGIIFAVAFALPGLAYRLFNLNAIFAFWFAYIMTRPLGASFADWSAKPVSLGGLGHGDGPVSFMLTVMIIIFVGYLSVTHKDSQSGRA